MAIELGGTAEATTVPAPGDGPGDSDRAAGRWWTRLSGYRTDVVVVAALVVAVAVLEAVLAAVITRPLWYDELWRAHYLSVPAGDFWSQIRHANSPSAIAWLAVERAVAAVGGWRAWVLRGPEVATLPLIAAGTYLLGRRFLGPVPAAVAAVVVGLGGTVLDLGLQLKPYSVEAIVTLATVGLWIAAPESGTGRRATRVRRLTGAGGLSLLSVPGALLLFALAVVDVAGTPGGRRGRLRAAVDTAPALGLAAAHALFFVARQSGQRDGSFWDGQFLAGRGIGGGLAFAGRQVWRVAGGLPTGIDRIDPNLVHAPTDGTWASTWVLAPIVVAAWVVGGRALWRGGRPGRLLVGSLAGTELVELVASGDRFWPFGAARPDLFLVPLLVLVATVGVVEGGRWLARLRVVPGRLVVTAGVVAALLLGWDTAATTARLWDARHGIRLESRVVDATATTRTLARPGDVVLVGGRLALTGWTYAMDASADGSTRAPRVPAADTTFLTAVGRGESVSALAARGLRADDAHGRRVLLFVLVSDRSGQGRELADLAGAGWCPTSPARSFANTGTLTVLAPCR